MSLISVQTGVDDTFFMIISCVKKANVYARVRLMYTCILYVLLESVNKWTVWI